MMNAVIEWMENWFRQICWTISTESLKNYENHAVQKMFEYVSNHKVRPKKDKNYPRYWVINAPDRPNSIIVNISNNILLRIIFFS